MAENVLDRYVQPILPIVSWLKAAFEKLAQCVANARQCCLINPFDLSYAR